MANNLGIMLGGAVQQRNTVAQQGLQTRALDMQQEQARRAQQQAQYQQIQDQMATGLEQARSIVENGGDPSSVIQAYDQQFTGIVNSIANSDPSFANTLGTTWRSGVESILSAPTPEQAATRQGELSATQSMAERNALVAGGAPDPWATSEPVPSSGMFDERGRANPTTQRLVQSTVGALYGATFDEAGNFVLPGDANQLREATEVTAEAIQLLERMSEIMTPAEASLIAQRNVRSRAGGITGAVTSGAESLPAAGSAPDNPLPPPQSQAELQDGAWYRTPGGEIVQYRGEKFYDRQGNEIQ